MANTFKDMMAHDFANVFANPHEFGVTLTLRRGGSETTSVKAVPHVVKADIQNLDGSFDHTGMQDFIVATSAYAFDDEECKPLAGDRIEIADGDKIRVYEVAPFAGMPCWEVTDPYSQELRIHTRELGTFNPSDENFLRSVSGVLPIPDGDTDAADRRHASGNVRVFE